MCRPQFRKYCIAGAASYLWQAQIRSTGVLCSSVIEHSVYNHLKVEGHEIHLPLLTAQNVRVIAALCAHTQQAACSKSTCRKDCIPFPFSLLPCHGLSGTDMKAQSSILTKCCLKCLLNAGKHQV